MSANQTPDTLTVSEIREILRIGTNSTYNLIHSKAFPVKRIGNMYRIPREPFYRWMGTQPPELAELLAGNSH
jgi:excisionase family DNA binding protein